MAAALPMILSIAGPMLGNLLGGGGDKGDDQQATALPTERQAPTVANAATAEAARRQAVRGAQANRFREGAEADPLSARPAAGAAKKQLLGV